MIDLSREPMRGRALLATRIWVVLGIIILIIAPRVAPVFVYACLIAPLFWIVAERRGMPAISVSPWASLLFLSALFLALASILSSAPSGAYYFVALLAFQIFAIFIVFTLLRELPRDVLTEMAVGLALGWSIAVLIFTLEFLTGGLMQVYFKGLLPDFLLTKRPVIDQRLNDFEFNRSVAIIALLAWVALAASLVLPLRNNIRLAVYAVVPIAASIIIESSA